MPVVTSCPDCGRKLRVPDALLGKKVRCPGCKGVFPAASAPEGEGAPPPPAPAPPREERIRQDAGAPLPRRPSEPGDEDGGPRDRSRDDEDYDRGPDEDELPRGRRRHEDDEYGDEYASLPGGRRAAWRKVVGGLNFVLISVGVWIALQILGPVVMMVLFAVLAAGGPGGGPPPAFVLGGGTGFMAAAVVMNLLSAANNGLRVYGHYLCLTGPDKPGTGLRRLALTTVVLYAVWAGLALAGAMVGVVSGIAPGMGFSMNPMTAVGTGVLAVILNGLAYLALLGGSVTFILYLRGVALAVRRASLARQLRAFLITAASLVGVAVLLVGIAAVVAGAGFYSMQGSRRPPTGAGANAAMGGVFAITGMFCLGTPVALGVYIWYVILLVQVRGAVADHVRR